MTRTLRDIEQELRDVARGEREPSSVPPAEDVGLLSLLAGNLDLLGIIERERPESVSALAERVGRAQSNVSRTLQALARHGIVRLVRNGKAVRPELGAAAVTVDLRKGSFSLSSAAE